MVHLVSFFIFILFFKFYFIFKLYIIVLVLPNIKMNPQQVLYSKTLLVVAHLFFKLEIYHSIHTKSNKWNQNVINVLVRQTLIRFLKYILYGLLSNYYSLNTIVP